MNNWAGNIQYGAATVLHPRSLDELCRFVRECNAVRVLGTRHSFNAIADPGVQGTMISLDKLDRVISLDNRDTDHPTVTVEGGITYGQLCPQLDRAGFALHNLASLPHISIAGAYATATHGSGNGNTNLAAAVVGMKIVDALGVTQVISEKTVGERFAGMVVGLGAFGPVVELTLKLQRRFDCAQRVFLNLPMMAVVADFDQTMSSAYSVSLFTDWRTPMFNQVWLKHRLEDEAPVELFGATPAATQMHPIRGFSAVPCTEQLGKPGPWHERLPHFRTECTPSSGSELQSEYFVPRKLAGPAIEAVYAMREQITPLIQVSEVRTVAADQLWMSPCFERDCASIHFTWIRDVKAVTALLPSLEKQLASFGAMPHWGKLFATENVDLRKLYKGRLERFCALVAQMDPAGKFSNDFLRHTILA